MCALESTSVCADEAQGLITCVCALESNPCAWMSCCPSAMGETEEATPVKPVPNPKRHAEDKMEKEREMAKTEEEVQA